MACTNNTEISVKQTLASGIFGIFQNATTGNGIGQGTGVSDRVGNKIKLQGIDLMITVNPDPSDAGMLNGSLCRFAVWHDKQCNGSLPTTSQILVTDAIYGNQNPNYEHRLVKHQEFVHSMVFTGVNSVASPASGPAGLYKIHIPAKTVIEFNGSTGGIANMVGDNWFFTMISDNDDCCKVLVEATIRFVDM